MEELPRFVIKIRLHRRLLNTPDAWCS